jgi:hypothetical protein
MQVLESWDLILDADAVLRGQGADPNVIRRRSPRLYEIATQALEEGFPLVRPKVLYERFTVDSIRHDQVRLNGGGILKSMSLAQHLGMAEEIIIAVCTIGPLLEELADKVMVKEIVRGLALYGAGSASVEALANAVCQQFETEADRRGWQSTIPLSPGMIGWGVEEGQPQIFRILDCSLINVTLTNSCFMLPIKSLSMVMGLGPGSSRPGSTCDICTMREVCKYQPHDVPNG